MKRLATLFLLLTACGESISTYPNVPPATTQAPAQTDAGIDAELALDAGSDAAPRDAAPPDAALDTDADISTLKSSEIDAQVVETTSFSTDISSAKTSDISTTAEAGTAQLDGGTEPALPDAATDAGPFVCPIPDVLGSECDLQTSCGCAEGLVCRTANHQTGQTLCFDSGTLPPYAACEFDQDCGAGSVCEGLVCRPLCDAPDTLCNDDSWCGKLADTGRTVCLGNCNTLPLALDRWKGSAAWMETQALQIERGLNTLPLKTIDYVGCGAGAYCSPGLEGVSPFPYCVAATGDGEEGSACVANEDCLTGYGCYENTCRVISFVSGDCTTNFKCVRNETTAAWGAPDGYNTLGACIPK